MTQPLKLKFTRAQLCSASFRALHHHPPKMDSLPPIQRTLLRQQILFPLSLLVFVGAVLGQSLRTSDPAHTQTDPVLSAQ